MLEQIRSFLAVIEEGSLHRAAARLRISQSTLSRQMQALEHELGGRLLERTSTGVSPTTGGHFLASRMKKLLEGYDGIITEVRRTVRGEGEVLRIGFLASAARQFLEPALGVMRRSHPDVKVKLLDLSPGEMITALRRGELDCALTDHGGELLSRDFYTRKLATVPLIAVLPASHRLASSPRLSIADLKDETFVYGSEEDVPGNTRRLLQLCRKYGKFRPKWIGPVQSLSQGLSMVGNENAVALMPAYVRSQLTPCLITIPLADAEAHIEIQLVWQRGKTPAPLKTLMSAIPSVEDREAGDLRQTHAA